MVLSQGGHGLKEVEMGVGDMGASNSTSENLELNSNSELPDRKMELESSSLGSRLGLVSSSLLDLLALGVPAFSSHEKGIAFA